MPHHIQVACHLGHQVAGTVAVVILTVLTLNLVVQINADVVHHVLRRHFVLHRREICQPGAEQRETDHAQAECNEQSASGSKILSCMVAGNERIDDTLADVGVHNRKTRAHYREAECHDIPCPVAFQVLPQPFEFKHLITCFLLFLINKHSDYNTMVQNV